MNVIERGSLIRSGLCGEERNNLKSEIENRLCYGRYGGLAIVIRISVKLFVRCM